MIMNKRVVNYSISFEAYINVGAYAGKVDTYRWIPYKQDYSTVDEALAFLQSIKNRDITDQVRCEQLYCTVVEQMPLPVVVDQEQTELDV